MYKTKIKRATSLKILLSLTFITNFTSVAKQQKLLPSDGRVDDYFGYSVAVDGTTALVGAYKADINLHEGAGVALHNDTAIISAMHYDAKNSDAGAAYVIDVPDKN